MGQSKFCDACGKYEGPGRAIEETEIIIRTLPGRTTGGGMQVGPGKLVAAQRINRKGKMEDTETVLSDAEIQPAGSSIYLTAIRDLCHQCTHEEAADKLKHRVKGDGKGVFPDLIDHGMLARGLNEEARTSETLVLYDGECIPAAEADKRKAATANFSDADKLPEGFVSQPALPEPDKAPKSGDSSGGTAMESSVQPETKTAPSNPE